MTESREPAGCLETQKNGLVTAFGLTLRSELALPELLAGNGQADAEIAFGRVPREIPQAAERTPWYEAAKGKFLHRVDGVAKYYAENGESILIEPLIDVSDQRIRLFLLNSVFPRLLQQRGCLVLHGAVAVLKGRAVAILGHTASGKSSLAFTLYRRGYEILSDEICALRYLDGKVFTLPETPWLKVWKDSLSKVGLGTDAYKPVRQGLEKYAVPVHDRFINETVELAGIVLLENHNRDGLDFEPILGANRLAKLAVHAPFPDMEKSRVQGFQRLTTAAKSRIMKLSFNERLYPLEKMADHLEKEWI
ncbi:MAG: hypothetical protein KBA53_04990 [Thermoclostridium sp.]|nr:hypothetical protein [Thermoclostridium sp.]